MPASSLTNSVVTLLTGALGAALGHALHFPLYLLTGPAVLVTALSLMGARFSLLPVFRDAAFLVIGLAVGAGVTPDTTAAFLRWPVAFAALAAMLVAILAATPPLLTRLFGIEPRAAVLASTPGHLSYVLSLSSEIGADLVQVSVIQSVRLFSLVMLVPFAALAFGVDLGGVPRAPGLTLPATQTATLLALGLALGLVLKRLRVPAALFIGAMGVSAAGHASELSRGGLDPRLAMAALVVIGSLIGTRFNGMTPAMLRRGLLAGLFSTVFGMALALAASWPVAGWLGMPLAHVLVAFAPGGLETMVAIGAVIGANPGFVAAAHVARLLALIVLVPLFVHRAAVRQRPRA